MTLSVRTFVLVCAVGLAFGCDSKEPAATPVETETNLPEARKKSVPEVEEPPRKEQSSRDSTDPGAATRTVLERHPSLPSPTTYPSWEAVACEQKSRSTHEALSIEFEKDHYVFSPEEVRGGVEIPYSIRIAQPLQHVQALAAEANEGRWCENEPVALLLYGVESGQYVTHGSCGSAPLRPKTKPRELAPQTIEGRFEWGGKVFQKGTRRQHSVDTGEFRLSVRLKGLIGDERFQVTGFVPVTVAESPADTTCRDIPHFTLNKYDRYFYSKRKFELIQRKYGERAGKIAGLVKRKSRNIIAPKPDNEPAFADPIRIGEGKPEADRNLFPGHPDYDPTRMPEPSCGIDDRLKERK